MKTALTLLMALAIFPVTRVEAGGVISSYSESDAKVIDTILSSQFWDCKREEVSLSTPKGFQGFMNNWVNDPVYDTTEDLKIKVRPFFYFLSSEIMESGFSKMPIENAEGRELHLELLNLTKNLPISTQGNIRTLTHELVDHFAKLHYDKGLYHEALALYVAKELTFPSTSQGWIVKVARKIGVTWKSGE